MRLLVTGAAAVVAYAGVIMAARVAGPELVAGGAPVARVLLLAAAALLATVLVWQTRELQSLSARDKLTGLLNRDIFDDLLQDATLRARRYGRPLSILMLEYSQSAALESAAVIGAMLMAIMIVVALVARRFGLQVADEA